MRTLRTLVVDDEPISKDGLIRMLNDFPIIETVGTAFSIEDFVNQVYKLKPDLVFLDIMLRDSNSLEILRNIETEAKFIITTAYGEHALKGYELNVVDYLMKPITIERLSIAIERASLICNTANAFNDTLFLRSEGRYHRFNASEILFVQGMENYVIVQTETGKYVCRLTMTYIKQLLPVQQFIYAHRSYIINTEKVDAIEKLSVYIKTFVLPISRDKKQEVYKILLGNDVTEGVYKK